MERSHLPESNQIKNLNKLLIALISFIVIWSIGTFLYIYKTSPREVKNELPIVTIDPSLGKITNNSYTNLFPKEFIGPPGTNNINNPLYEQKSHYEKLEFVIINYFFIPGIVIDRQGDNYTIIYKSYNRVLEKIIVPKELLLSPSSASGVNPASLLAP